MLNGNSSDPTRLAATTERMARAAYRRVRRLMILLVGGTLLVVGAVMILLPGPASIVIPVALGVLALEFAWARRLLERTRQEMGRLRERTAQGAHGLRRALRRPTGSDEAA